MEGYMKIDAYQVNGAFLELYLVEVQNRLDNRTNGLLQVGLDAQVDGDRDQAEHEERSLNEANLFGAEHLRIHLLIDRL